MTRRLTDDQLDAMADMRAAGQSYLTISRVFGCSESAIAWNCLRLGVEPDGVVRPVPVDRRPMVIDGANGPIRRFTPDEDHQLLEMAGAGRRYQEMAERLQRRWSSVYARLMVLARHDQRREALEQRAHAA